MNSGKPGQIYKKPGKKKGKKLTDHGSFDFDLLYHLSYMSVIAGAGAPRNQLFRRAAELECDPAKYFDKIERTRRKLGCDYARACKMVGEDADNEDMKSLLLRLSSALVSGEPEAEFLAREADAHAKTFHNEYTRTLEGLKQWTNAYVALTLSAILIIIIGVVSTMIWTMNDAFIIGVVGISVGIAVLGVWLIYLLSPREIVVPSKPGSREQKLVRKLIFSLSPLAIALVAALAFIGLNPGLIMIAFAVVIFPIGFVAARDDKRICARDTEVGPFLRSLGGVSAAIGTTIRDALSRLDLDSITALRPQVRRLNARLHSGIRGRFCWQRFTEETGSELARRSISMFYDVVEVGGEPEQAGYRSSVYASGLSMLRAQRKTISLPFRWLCVAMHGAVIALLVFVVEVIVTFGSMVGDAQAALPDTAGGLAGGSFTNFNYAGLDIMQQLVLPLVVVFTIANALAPSIADGGSRGKIFYNLSVTTMISGICLAALPDLAGSLFSSIQN